MIFIPDSGDIFDIGEIKKEIRLFFQVNPYFGYFGYLNFRQRLSYPFVRNDRNHSSLHLRDRSISE